MIDDDEHYLSSDAFQSPFLTNADEVSAVRELALKPRPDSELWELTVEALLGMGLQGPATDSAERKARIYGEFLRHLRARTDQDPQRVALILTKFKGVLRQLPPDLQQTLQRALVGSLTRHWIDTFRSLPSGDPYRTAIRQALLGKEKNEGYVKVLPKELQKIWKSFIKTDKPATRKWKQIIKEHPQQRLALMDCCQPVPFTALVSDNLIGAKELMISQALLLAEVLRRSPKDFRRLVRFEIDNRQGHTFVLACLCRTLLDEGSAASLELSLEVESVVPEGEHRDSMHALMWLLKMAMLATAQDWAGFAEGMQEWNPGDLDVGMGALPHSELVSCVSKCLVEHQQDARIQQWQAVNEWVGASFIGSFS